MPEISPRRKQTAIRRIFEAMHARFGPHHWWPGDGIEEMIVGVVLTQNTNWGNVERALANLKRARALALRKIARLPHERLAELIRPAGYFNVKARRLRAVAQHFVENWKLDFTAARQIELPQLREELLDVYGLGPESVDSILLYGLERPSFVIDAYTLRIGARHGLFPAGAKYDEAKALFERSLAPDVALYNEYHAALVHVGKDYCKPRPACADCPLNQTRLFLDPAAAP